MRAVSRSILVGLAGAACFSVGVATSQHTPPTDNKGVTQDVVTSLDLGDQIEGMAGRQLRMRKILIEPGGHVALHEHTNRPALVFIQQGEFTDHRLDGTSKAYTAGQGVAEGVTTKHWAANTGSTPLVLITVDIYAAPK